LKGDWRNWPNGRQPGFVQIEPDGTSEREWTRMNLWDRILVNLQQKVNSQSFNTWLRPTQQLSLADGALQQPLLDREVFSVI